VRGQSTPVPLCQAKEANTLGNHFAYSDSSRRLCVPRATGCLTSEVQHTHTHSLSERMRMSTRSPDISMEGLTKVYSQVSFILPNAYRCFRRLRGWVSTQFLLTRSNLLYFATHILTNQRDEDLRHFISKCYLTTPHFANLFSRNGIVKPLYSASNARWSARSTLTFQVPTSEQKHPRPANEPPRSYLAVHPNKPDTVATMHKPRTQLAM
jgi:hypothetical protein